MKETGIHKETIRVEQLTCGYGRKFILRDIGLEIASGEFVSIIGPNGSGKTTLLRAMTGILPVVQGRILLNGEDISGFSYRERATRMAVVNQKVEVGSLSVEDYVLLGRTPYRSPFQFFESQEDWEIAAENIRLTGMWENREMPMNQLSGGEQQLAAVARALTQQTGIVLLDEPTAHLDIAHQMKILGLVRQLNREKHLTVILVVHDLNLASEFSDRLILLNEGRVHTTGAPKAVLTAENIEQVYHARVEIHPSPVSGHPFLYWGK